MSKRLLIVKDWEEFAKRGDFEPIKVAVLCRVSLRQLERHFKHEFNKTPEKLMREPLSNGLVLVAGGESGGVTVSDAEVYNSGTGGWTPTCLLNTGRWGQSATLLTNGYVLTEGGYTGSASLSSSELYP